MFQNNEMRNTITKIVPNIRNINQVREGRLVIGTLLDLPDAAPLDLRQHQTAVRPISVVSRVQKKA